MIKASAASMHESKNKKDMANLKELCGNIPQSMLHTAANYEVARRKVAAHRRQQKEYNERMKALDMERCIFEQCKRNRTQKRVRNTWSTEQAGRSGGGSFIATCRNVGTTQITEVRGGKYHKKSVRTYSVKNYGSQVCRVQGNKY